MPYCRPSVEKYVFAKLYDKLFAMYAIKNEDEDRLFVERSGQIKRQKAHDIMRYLGIKENFIFGDNQAHTVKFEDHLKDLSTHSQYDSHRSDQNYNLLSSHNAAMGVDNNLFNNTSTSSINMGSVMSAPTANHLRNELPYIDAIRAIEKM